MQRWSGHAQHMRPVGPIMHPKYSVGYFCQNPARLRHGRKHVGLGSSAAPRACYYCTSLVGSDSAGMGSPSGMNLSAAALMQ